ncbi:hypothetical protein ILT44_25420 [Microvirga sp. BT689]|uniref:hypothetical protein n=1 Tax=Microvirga arvi TaxID=2778731 RepID=UPI001951F32A|nr:hypothetical protein [Microvirga arvi]MBM6583544.1 hypothetical protein [Microvirga arvi]
MSQVLAAALFGALTMTMIAAPTARFTREKIESFAELDRAMAVGTPAKRSGDISLRVER